MQEEGVLRGQELENSVLDADYNKAIQIAFELCRPHKLFESFAELCRLAMILHKYVPVLTVFMLSHCLIQISCRKDGSNQIETALRVLGKEEIHLPFEYIREWNTKPKFCHVAQYVLFGVFNIFPPTEILEVII